MDQKFNLHTHTMRCGHAEGLDCQYVQSAIDAGLSMLGFSDHVPFKDIKRPGDRMSIEQNEEYITSIKSLQKEFIDKIDIKIGYEIEYLEDQIEHLKNIKKECDYMILGQHLKYIDYEYDCYCSEEDVLEYTRQVEDAMKSGLITYVAHPDYYMLGRRTFSKVCKEAAHRIAKASITYDIPLEINLNGFKYGKKNYQFYHNATIYEKRYPYPFREFWQIISEYQCKVLYGYDAHSPIALLEKDREYEAEEILKDIPLNFIKTITLK